MSKGRERRAIEKEGVQQDGINTSVNPEGL